MSEYRLYVEYPFRGSLEHDEKIEEAVGEGRIGSGAGVGFRDMEWIFEGEDAKQKAEAALERVNALKIDGMTAKIWEENEEEEQDEPVGACEVCNGPLMVIGTLGDLRHARCRDCGLQFSFRVCPHGEPIGDCNACDVAGDLAFDAAREDEHFGR